MSNEVKRKGELLLCMALHSIVPEHRFVPYKGGTQNSEEEEMEPPFTIVNIENAEKNHPFLKVYQCSGAVQVISHSAESSSVVHAELVKRVSDALISLQPHNGCDCVFHGLDVSSTRSAVDSESECWADIIEFTAGFTG
jgi:hypothetical protein